MKASPSTFCFVMGLLVLSSGLSTANAQQVPPTSDKETPKAAEPPPYLVLQTGHTAKVSSVAFSPNGRLIATAGGDGTTRLWDVATGREVRKLEGPSSGFAEFSPDGRLLVTSVGGSLTFTLTEAFKLWDVESGREVRTFSAGDLEPNTYDFNEFPAFSPDGRWLALGDQYGDVRVWEAETGRQLSTFKTSHALRGMKIAEDLTIPEDASIRLFDVSKAFSPDGRWLASAGQFERKTDRTLKDRRGFVILWEMATGQKLSFVTAQFEKYSQVRFSPDGRLVAAVGYSYGIGGTLKLWDVATRQEVRTLTEKESFNGIAFSPDGRWLATTIKDKIKLFDVATWQEALAFTGQAERIHRFSHDGRLLASSPGDGSITLWDVATGKVVRTLKSHTAEVSAIAFSPDGRWQAMGDQRGVIKLWDVTTGRLLHTLSSRESKVTGLAIGPDGRVLASVHDDFGSNDQRIALWDTATGRPLRWAGSFPKIFGNESISFSPDGRWLIVADPYERPSAGRQSVIIEVATGRPLDPLIAPERLLGFVTFSPDGRLVAIEVRTIGERNRKVELKLYEVATLREIHAFAMDWIYSVAFSPDGRSLAAGGSNAVRLWDVATGRELRTLSECSNPTFSPDGHLLASSCRGQPLAYAQIVKLCDANSGRLLHTLTGHTMPVTNIAFNPDGRTLASSSKDDTIKLWDTATGKELQTFKTPKDYDYISHADALTFGARGRWLASGGANRFTEVWDVESGRRLRPSALQNYLINHFIISQDGRWLISAGTDGATRVWDVETGQEVAALVNLRETGDWLVVTPEGLFDGSPAAWNQIVWRFAKNEIASVETFFNEFYHPGLLADILAGKKPKAPRSIAQVDRRQPEVRLSLARTRPAPNQAQAPANESVSTRTVSIKVEVGEAPAGASRPAGSGARDVRLFRNGALVKVWRGDVLAGKPGKAILEVSVPIVAGENRLTAYAFNRDNIKSSDATLNVTGAESLRRKGVAWVLAVGVNEYANAQYNLKYAVADADGFAEEVKRQQTKLSQYERVEIISLNDKAATKANFLKSLTDLSGKIQPEDAVIIFFAGHGTAQGNRFYLIPHDLGYSGSRTQLESANLQSILSHSISDEDIERAVEAMDAGQFLLVIDACNSGQALEAEEKRRGPMNSKGLAQLAYEKGMYILTAAQSYQAAQEAARLGHGYLTYALVEEGLKTNLSDRAPKDGQVLLREWLDFATGRVPQMQQEKIDEQQKQGRQLEQVIKFAEADADGKRSIQRPRVFYRREAEVSPLIVAKP